MSDRESIAYDAHWEKRMDAEDAFEQAVQRAVDDWIYDHIIRCGECKRAEHEPSGVRCGLSDVLMGRTDSALSERGKSDE